MVVDNVFDKTGLAKDCGFRVFENAEQFIVLGIIFRIQTCPTRGAIFLQAGTQENV